MQKLAQTNGIHSQSECTKTSFFVPFADDSVLMASRLQNALNVLGKYSKCDRFCVKDQNFICGK